MGISQIQRLITIFGIVFLLFFAGCSKKSELPPVPTPPPHPEADFFGQPLSGAPGMQVSFTNLSQDAEGWNWDFGDGGSSLMENPSHVFENAGQFDVRLIAINETGRDTITKHDYIEVSLRTPKANFGASPQSGSPGVAVEFSDLSSNNPTSWQWDFGDESKSYDQNPSHIYTDAGSFDVSLIVANAAGEDTLTKSDFIQVTASLPVADFSATPRIGPPGLTVEFTDMSTSSPNSWFWEFGDGSSSHLQNPTHIYDAIGLYSVSLTVGNEEGSDSKQEIGYIEVEPDVVASFSKSVGSGEHPLTVVFTNTSAGTFDNCTWSFGDGSSDSGCGQVAHEYSSAGEYSVSLSISGDGGSDVSPTQVIIVTNPEEDYLLNNLTYGPLYGINQSSADDTEIGAGASVMAEAEVSIATPTSLRFDLYLRVREPGGDMTTGVADESYTINTTSFAPAGWTIKELLVPTSACVENFVWPGGFTPVTRGCFWVDLEILGDTDNRDTCDYGSTQGACVSQCSNNRCVNILATIKNLQVRMEKLGN